MTQPATSRAHDTPLCVDLDGTLIKTDLLYEAVLLVIKTNILYLFLLPVWLLRGKAAFKAAVIERVNIAVDRLPYHDQFLSYLKAEHAKGRPLILATAAHHRIADRVAEHVGLFTRVLATEGGVNLAGRRKAELLVKTFGSRRFDYAGNDFKDLHVWKESNEAVVVTSNKSLLRRAKSLSTVNVSFEARSAKGLWLVAKAMRIHQWVKNVLIFVPLVMAHRLTDIPMVLQTLAAFAIFSLAASGVYVLNDLVDLESDRAHPVKRLRPFASGDLSIATGVVLATVLTVGSVVAGFLVSTKFGVALVGYQIMTLTYSLYIKKKVLADVLLLACLYTWRIFAGAFAVDIALSPWLLAFSVFLFFSLALVKRVSELKLMQMSNQQKATGRGYRVDDLPQLAMFGSSSSYVAILVFALYINSDHVKTLYARPESLWCIVPAPLYWTSRVWFLTQRGEMHHDPIVFALKDRTSYVLGIIVFAILCIAQGIS